MNSNGYVVGTAGTEMDVTQTATAGGATVAGGMRIVNTGLTVNSGGLTVVTGSLNVQAGSVSVAQATASSNIFSATGITGAATIVVQGRLAAGTPSTANAITLQNQGTTVFSVGANGLMSAQSGVSVGAGALSVTAGGVTLTSGNANFLGTTLVSGAVSVTGAATSALDVASLTGFTSTSVVGHVQKGTFTANALFVAAGATGVFQVWMEGGRTRCWCVLPLASSSLCHVCA